MIPVKLIHSYIKELTEYLVTLKSLLTSFLSIEHLSDPTTRFTNRVDQYVKYRPGYPEEVISYLQDKCTLPENAVIADIGSGTGIFTSLLLARSYRVLAVEPNNAMQQAAVRQFEADRNFTPVNGTAEATTLSAACTDLITCAQAFHWFDQDRTKTEFKRILKPSGMAALIWNNRRADSDDFSVAYERLLKESGTDYTKVNHRNIGDVDFESFFRNGIYEKAIFSNKQVFDEDGLMGRAYSSSYVPAQDTVEGQAFGKKLSAIFEKHNINGRVDFVYDTEVYIGSV